ncbi:MAG TPA: cohesin domain-containing protein [Candidatus Paceibacterota bacterium]|nr:cohesin domain-containing protein [Candidatus Paceibacterota bacterium]
MHKTLLAALMFFGALVPLSASAASLSLDPSGGTFGPGDTFLVHVRLDPDKDCVNAAHLEITYPAQTLRAIDVSRGDSIFSLWPEEPAIDNTLGRITFSGGVPGGYCGVISGDPAKSDVVADLVFTVLKSDARVASVQIDPSSEVYLNDGLGTKAHVSIVSGAYTLVDAPLLTSNQWLDELRQDTTPPEPFTVQVESTSDVFGGAYYAVFSTVDKQSGIDHYEINEGGAWKRVTSPYELHDQLLQNGVEVKAVDKAGNERIGTYNASSTPPRATRYSLAEAAVLFVILVVLATILWFWETRKRVAPPLS